MFSPSNFPWTNPEVIEATINAIRNIILSMDSIIGLKMFREISINNLLLDQNNLKSEKILRLHQEKWSIEII